jgi:ABC-type transport system involved in multi-copper enzyme maturation permease subunit
LHKQAQLIQKCQEHGLAPAPTAGSEATAPTPGDCGTIQVNAEDKRWRATDTLNAVKGIVVLGALLCFVIGASAGGAEWASGTLQALLFWEPRRLRVMAAKALALTGVVTAIGVMGQLLITAGTWMLSVTRGTTEGYTADAWTQILGAQGRGIALLVIAAVTAFSVSSLTRHTTAALGAAFGYLVIAEPLLLVWKPGLLRYLLTANFGALVDGRLTDADTSTVISAGSAGFALSVYVLALFTIATVLFQRRDVT